MVKSNIHLLSVGNFLTKISSLPKATLSEILGYWDIAIAADEARARAGTELTE